MKSHALPGRVRASLAALLLFGGIANLPAPPTSPPTISDIPDQRTFPGIATRALAFTVGDGQTAAGSLILTATSSNTNLVPNANIGFGGAASNRTVTVTPVTAQSGAATITVTVTDGQGESASDSFVLTMADFMDAGLGILGLSQGQLAWGDYDNDGDLDLIQTGIFNGPAFTQLYRNDTTNGFVLMNTPFPNLSDSAVAWGDYDNDGWLDVLLAGRDANAVPHSEIYHNNGNGTFSLSQALTGTATAGGSVAWCDFNGDGRLDALVSGWTGPNDTVIYRNNGAAGFSVVTNTGLTGVLMRAVACADYDQDGRPDILMLGTDNTFNVARLYRNLGGFSFSNLNVNLPVVSEGSVGWGDYDNDGDLDILIAGSIGANGETHVFRNDGGNSFNDINAPLPGVRGGKAIWGDYDNDGDLDILVMGVSGPDFINKIFRNDAGGFSDSGIVLPGTYQASVSWGDYDNDGDLDFAFCGYTPAYGVVTKIFRNLGAMPDALPGAPTGLSAVTNGNAITLSWLAPSDANQTNGLTYNVRVGTNSSGVNLLSPMAHPSTGLRRIPALGNAGNRLSLTLTNLSGGMFYYWSVQAVDHTFAGGPFAAPASVYVDAKPTVSDLPDLRVALGAAVAPIPFTVGDVETPAGALQVTVSSSNTNLLPTASILLGGAGTNRTLTLLPTTNLVGDSVLVVTVRDAFGNTASDSFRFSVAGFVDLGLALPGYTTRPSLAWGDIDNDGLLDFYVTGNDGTGPFNTSGRLYLNLGGGSFSANTNSLLPTAQQGDMAFGDSDNDGDLDVVMQGGLFVGVQVWRNNGNRTFSYAASTESMYEAAVAWGDFNNDGQPDFAAGGWNSSTMFTRLMQNAGGNAFNNVATVPGTMFGDLNWGDYDNDGDLDLALVGYQSFASYFCAVYRNYNGTLTNSGNVFPAGFYANDWGDFDNDGDLDLLFSRHDVWGSNQLTVIYVNNGAGSFTDSGIRLPGIVDGSLQFGDFDNDGWLDILMTGASPSLGTNITRVYRNNHNSTFTDIQADLPAISNGRAAWGDFDNDGDLDILVTGAADGLGLITRIFRNDIVRSNTPPSAPGALATLISTNRVRFSWNAASDPNQSQGLSYNLRVGRSPGAADVMSPAADATTGWHRLPQRGNADLSRGWLLKNLAPGTYYWSVQAIDHGFAASPFAAEQSFVVTQPPQLSSISGLSIHVNSQSAPLPFTVSDAETPADNLLLTAQSSNPTLLPSTNIVFGGSGTNRTVTLIPAPDKIGSTIITITLTDAEGWSTNRTFGLDVFNSAPVISDVTNQTVLPNRTTAPLPFTISDAETAAADLLITAASTNPNLVPVPNILLGGSGSNRTVTVVLASNQVGTATLTLTVTDPHGGSVSDSFTVKVQEFQEVDAGFPALDCSAAAWGDFNNDGQLDLLISGYASSVYVTRLYRNTGNGGFTNLDLALPGLCEGSVAWGDYNHDGRLDFLLTGGTNGTAASALTLLYRNNGDETFTLVEADLPGVFGGAGAFADFDNDGLPDIALTGSSPAGDLTRIYRNNGNDSFTDLGLGLPALSFCSLAAADYDRDGRLDLIVAGEYFTNASFQPITRLYHNEGSGKFAESGVSLPGVFYPSLAWGDYDRDGAPDILISGATASGGLTQLYRNLGNGFFTGVAIGLPQIDQGTCAWGDYDNDGKLDILQCGISGSTLVERIYRGSGTGTFTDINAGLGLLSTQGGTALWGDFDNDGALDALLSGVNGARIYRNLSPNTNTPPLPPAGLSVSISSNAVLFAWSAATDLQSGAAGLGYNLRVGTTPGGADVVSPLAGADGWRRVVQAASIGNRTNWTLLDPPQSGTYFWSVQAVDGAYAGSGFAAEQTFTAAFAPTAKTLPAANVTNTSANLNALVTAKGALTAVAFEWGTTTNFGNTLDLGTVSSNAVNAALLLTLTNLTADTTYYFRIVASNQVGVSRGIILNFMTGNPPGLAPLAPTGITAAQATLRASVNPNHSPSGAWIEYGLTTNYSTTTAVSGLGSGTNTVIFSRVLTGLTGGTTYHYRTVATNEYGITVSADAVFSTTSEPFATTLIAIATNLTSVTFAAVINPNGQATTAYFEYGLTTNYGFITAFTNVGNGPGNLNFTQSVSGLQPGTVYNFRVVAANATAATNGLNRSVRTSLPFTNVALRLPPLLLNGAVAWGDYNNDGRLDLIVCGATNTSTGLLPVTRLYRNDGTNFTELNPGIPGLRYGAVAWGDYNNDGRLDLLVCGSTNSIPSTAGLISRVYRNDGNDVFTDSGVSLPGVYNSAVAWADFNNDGRLDFILAGATNVTTSTLPISRVYLNNRAGGFTNVIAGLPGIQNGAVACADYNNDGRVDLLLAGATNFATSNFPLTAVFRNTGNGTFTNANAGLIGARDAAVAWGDFDDDGDFDILVAGNTNTTASTTTTTPMARVYRNNGNGTFSDINAGLAGVYRAAVAWADQDGDGRLDILLCGESTNSTTFVCNTYHNTGSGTFEAFGNGITATTFSTAAFGDQDNDGRLDLFLGGQMPFVPGGGVATLYRNLHPVTNTPPSAPGNPQQLASAGSATLRWDPASDSATAASGLTYNLRIGITPGGAEIMTPLAAADGRRRVVALGNVGQRKLWTLTNLPPTGTFYWAVQAIDQSFAGSAFTPEQVLVLSGPPTVTPAGLSNLAPTTVTLNGRVDANGFDTALAFEWGLTTNYGNVTPVQNLGSGAAFAPVAASLNGLAPFTVYQWRLVATNSSGFTLSSNQTFLTPDVPFLSSPRATNLTATSATLIGSVQPRGAATAMFFEYGLSTSYGFTTTGINAGSGTNFIGATNLLLNLQAGVSYHYRALASNVFGWATGSDNVFTTVPPPVLVDSAVVANGQFLIQLSGATNLTYEIQVSTNLLNWSVLGPTTLATNGLHRFLDTAASNAPYRFYRARSP